MRYVLFINCLCVCAVVAFLACVYSHDNGVPATISQAEKLHFAQVLSEYESRFDDVISDMEAFALDPDQETERSADLLNSLEQLRPVVKETLCNPLFFVSIRENINLAPKLTEQGNRFDDATQMFVDEIARRHELGIWDRHKHKEEAVAFQRIFDIECTVCSPSDCFMCRCKRLLSL